MFGKEKQKYTGRIIDIATETVHESQEVKLMSDLGGGNHP